MQTDLVIPKNVLRVEPDAKGGWLVELGCGHTVWYPRAPGKALSCGICAQRLVRQIHQMCAEQAPPPFRAS
jgi:hypothetical protein